MIKIFLQLQKPDDWLDDEPEFVPDPNGVKPDDWDEEEDGEWEAPQIGESDIYILGLAKCCQIAGCSLGIRGRGILHLLGRILLQMFSSL